MQCEKWVAYNLWSKFSAGIVLIVNGYQKEISGIIYSQNAYLYSLEFLAILQISI